VSRLPLAIGLLVFTEGPDPVSSGGRRLARPASWSWRSWAQTWRLARRSWFAMGWLTRRRRRAAGTRS